jgi:hypothetical protein
MFSKKRIVRFGAVILVGLGATPAVTGQVISNTNPTNRIIFPAEGQTPEQQMADQHECYSWAVQATGVDPVLAEQQLYGTAQSAQGNVDATQGSAVRGAARGAAAGAAIGAIAGDAGKGAAIGATAGGMSGVFRRRDQAMAEQNRVDQAQQQYQQQMSHWDRAYMTCLQGKSYTVN